MRHYHSIAALVAVLTTAAPIGVSPFPYVYPFMESEIEVHRMAALLRGQLQGPVLDQLGRLVISVGNTHAEGGGFLYYAENALHFSPVPNLADGEIHDLRDKNVADLPPRLMEVLTSRFSGYSCSPQSADTGWNEKINTLQAQLVEVQQSPITPEYLVRLREIRDQTIDSLMDIYIADPVKDDVSDGVTAHVHTHRNRTAFSSVDKCISGTSKDTMVLVSYDGTTLKDYDIYVMIRGVEVMVGTYKVHP